MKILRYILIIIICSFIISGSYAYKRTPINSVNKDKIVVIFETDMGNDIDDALALDMLYKYSDMGKVKLLAISINKDNAYPKEFVDIMNTWYGYPHIPIGQVINGIEDKIPNNYAKTVCEYEIKDEKPFKRSVSNHNVLPESTKLYRRLLSSQPDSSVIIISVGYFTNLARLLDTEADEFSPLNGEKLVAQKVKLLSAMAGNFEEKDTNLHNEYNIVKDIVSAKRVFDKWPVQIILSPFELGESVLFPSKVIEKDLFYIDNHPLRIAYENYLPMPYDRPTWDLTAVLYAIESKKNYFKLSKPGKIEVDSSGRTLFKTTLKGKHFYLSIDEDQALRIKKRFIELITLKPLCFK